LPPNCISLCRSCHAKVHMGSGKPIEVWRQELADMAGQREMAI
jgi:hypothetical protein